MQGMYPIYRPHAMKEGRPYRACCLSARAMLMIPVLSKFVLMSQKACASLDSCTSSLHKGHADLLCLAPISVHLSCQHSTSAALRIHGQARMTFRNRK